jgi:hypothetical protein
MSFEAARDRTIQEFDRRIMLIESVECGRWTPALEKIARADGADHYRSHRSYLRPPG